jgi:hypothetical protein
MKTTRARRLTVLLLVALLLAACATTPSRPVRSEFADIPVPKGMTYVPDRSTIIETPNVKAARFVYRGRLELEGLHDQPGLREVGELRPGRVLGGVLVHLHGGHGQPGAPGAYSGHRDHSVRVSVITRSGERDRSSERRDVRAIVSPLGPPRKTIGSARAIVVPLPQSRPSRPLSRPGRLGQGRGDGIGIPVTGAARLPASPRLAQ